MTDIEATRRDEIKRTLRCIVFWSGLVAMAFVLSALFGAAHAAVKPVQPDNIDRPGTYRHIPKGCTDTQPREAIRLRMFKMDKDGKLVQVAVVLIPKNC